MYKIKIKGNNNNKGMMNLKKRLAIFLSVVMLIMVSGCSLVNDSAKDATVIFLDQYKNLSASVLTGLEEVVEQEDLEDAQKELYRDILKKQYSDLKYEVLEETYDGDTAVVKVKLTVYDLYKAQSDAAKYLQDNMEEFKDENGSYSDKLYLDYKLEQMKKMTDKVEYTIDINCKKNDKGKWQVEDLSQTDLEKIHGIYDYNS